MGCNGLGFAGYEGWKLEGGETNIVVMKPDMAARPKIWVLSIGSSCVLFRAHSNG